jgi:hypothetical protein
VTAINDITGDKIQTKANSPEYRSNHEKIFGVSRVKRGLYKQDPETRKFIPAHEWNAKYGAPRHRGPLVIVDNFDAYESPATGEIISNRRQRIADMDKSGSRQYEGFHNEKQEADKWHREQDARLDAKIDSTLHKTMYEIEHGYRKP